jgi:hypothetical protein
MTGNVVFLGCAAVGVPGFSVAREVVALAGFVVGAMLGGHLGVAMAGVTRRRWLLTVAVVEAGLFFVATAVPDLTTTVLTMTLTGLAADAALAGGRTPRLGWRLAAVLAIFAGSAVGAVLVSLGGLTPSLVVTGACILLVTVAYAAHPASQAVASDVHQ